MAGELHFTPDPVDIVHCHVRGRDLVEFIRHARERMAERGVSEEDVLLTLQQPDDEGLPVSHAAQPEGPPRFRVRRLLNKTVALEVIFEELPDRIVVISTIVKQSRLSGRF